MYCEREYAKNINYDTEIPSINVECEKIFEKTKKDMNKVMEEMREAEKRQARRRIIGAAIIGATIGLISWIQIKKS